YPERLDVGPLTSYGFEHQLLLLVPLNVSKDFQSAQNVELSAKVDWLICQEMCVPGKTEVNLSLPVSSSVTFNDKKALFDLTRSQLPQSMDSISARVYLKDNQWNLIINTPVQDGVNMYFFPFRDDVIEHAAEEMGQKTEQGYHLLLTKSHLYQGNL